MEARSRIRIATTFHVRTYRHIKWKYTDHGVMCVITRYADWRLEVYGSNQNEIGKKNNSTSELNDRSLESNRCGAEKQRSENTGNKQIQKKGSLSGKCRGRNTFVRER